MEDASTFHERVADKLRDFADAESAFTAFKPSVVQKQLDNLSSRNHLARLNSDPHSEVGRQLLLSFLEGFRESQRCGEGEGTLSIAYMIYLNYRTDPLDGWCTFPLPIGQVWVSRLCGCLRPAPSL